MNILASLFNQQQQIAQNPTSVVKTPRQQAYENLMNAQQQAQNTTSDEWGSMLGHTVNGLAKIVASQAIKNPYERAGATRNLDNFDDRQDALARNWALQRMKQRNDYVQQAKDQLGLAIADENEQYNRDFNARKMDYQRMIDERNWDNLLKQQEEKKRQQEIDNKWREIDDINKREAREQAKIQQDFDNKIKAQNAKIDNDYKQAQINKMNYENSPEYKQQVQKQEQDKIRQAELQKYKENALKFLEKGLIDKETYIKMINNPELFEQLENERPKVPYFNVELPFESKKFNLPKQKKEDFQIMQDANGNIAKVYSDGRIEEI